MLSRQTPCKSRKMATNQLNRLNHLLSSDEAPDTGDDSDEDLVTNYLGNSGIGNDTLVPSIHITPQSPNSNHVLEDNLLQLAQIQEHIQGLRMANAQANLNVTSTNSKGRLSTSCPSLNDSCENLMSDDNTTSNTTNNSTMTQRDHNKNPTPRNKIDSNANTGKNRKIRQGRHRSVSISTGDSEGDDTDVDRTAQKTRQKKEISSSAAVKSSTPPSFKESRFFHGNRHKSPQSQLPSLHKSVSTPSIVVDGKQKKKKREEPTHVFLQRLIAENDWTRPLGSDTDTEDETPHQTSAVRSVSTVVGHTNNVVDNGARTHPIATQMKSTPSPQLSLAEFLQDDPTLQDDRKQRRKKERSSIFFRKKKDKASIGNSSANLGGKASSALYEAQQLKGGLTKVSSSKNLGAGSKPESQGQGGSKMSQHSQSMSSLRKSSISAPSLTAPLPLPVALASNSNFYLGKSDFVKNYDENDLANEDTTGLLESEFIPGEEFAEGGGPAAIRDLETPPHLRIEEEEPDTWTQTVSAKYLTMMSSADIKRQEHIYEFIITESNHCQVLKLMQKIFVEGMFKYLSLSKDIVDRIFPQIDTLIDLHFRFLEELRARQNQNPVVETIADILHAQFSAENGEKWQEAYGFLCSGHNEAVSVYKDLMKSDRRFQQFVRQCSENPLLKKKGVPECLFFVTTRITKYPLLIEPLKKYTRDKPAELELLRQANIFVKDILKEINACVAEKERKQRMFDIYNKIDPKASLLHHNRKFKKSDLLLSDRKLMFEGVANLQQNQNQMIKVNVVILSDVLFFLQESNQKFYFFTPDGKPSIVSVKTLIARERSGGTSKSLNLLSTEGFEQEPEVYELEIMQPSTREDWIAGIREAVDAATPGSDSDPDNDYTNELRKSVDNKYLRLRRLTAELRGKDIELSHVLESKMKTMHEILGIVQGDDFKKPVVKPEYINLVREKKSGQTETDISKEQLLATVQEASRLASSIYSSVTNLSRSVSSAGEKHTNVYSSPSLPRRAETFSGFDKELTSQKPKIKEIDIGDGSEREIITSEQNPQVPAPTPPAESIGQMVASNKPDMKLPGPQPLFMTLDPEQQQAATQLTHYMNTVMCLVAEHFTSHESMKTELSEIQEKASISGGRFKQNQRFEEMRKLQDDLAQEQKEWNTTKDALEKELDAKKKEKDRIQSEIDRGLKDVKEQREQLYRKLEVLRDQGIELGPNLSVLKKDPSVSTSKSPSAEVFLYKETVAATPKLPPNLVPSSGGGSASSIRKSSSLTSSSSAILTAANNIMTGGSLKKESFANLHLMSAANESKVVDKHDIKQQIPVKLSSLSNLSKVSKKSNAFPSTLVATSSASNISNLSSGTSASSSTGKGISNLAVKPDAVQQLLPMKLSELSVDNSGKSSKGSPKQHSGSNSKYHQSQQFYHQFESSGSSPPQQPMVYQQHHNHQQQQKEQHKQQRKQQQHGGSLRYTTSNNTLSKSSSGKIQKVTNYGSNTGGGSSGAEGEDDKVIFF